MKLLHLDSSILGANSASRTLSAAAVAQLTASRGDVQVAYRDLAAEPIAQLSGPYLAALMGAEGRTPPDLTDELEIGRAVLEEFLAADTVVIGVALYNFTIATQLKSWIDRIVIPGQTFRYTETGPVGLAGAKRIILTIARGGFYGEGSAGRQPGAR